MTFDIKTDLRVLGGTILGNYTSAARVSLSLTAADAGFSVYDTDIQAIYFWTGSVWSTFTSAANLSFGTITATQVPLNIDSGSDVVFNGATTSLAGLMTATDKTNLDALLALDGVAPGSLNLGTFTGTTINDATTIKGALQQLETAHESFVSQKGAANGLATLDSNGFIPTAQLPSLAITDVYVVADIAARDALTVQEGDVAKVNDAGAGNPQTYIYDGSTWIDIQETSDVISVNGQTGVVNLTAANVSYNNSSSGLTASTLQAAVDELDASIDSLQSASFSASVSFTTVDWVGPSSGFYNVTISAATHGLNAANLQIASVQESISANEWRNVLVRTSINTSNGNVILRVRANPDARFDGRVILTSAA